MAIKTKTDIKSFFQTGDKPTSGNYIDFIDSTVFIDTPSTGSVDVQGTGSFEGGINCIPTDGEGGTGSFGYISASGDISASGTGSFTGGINSIEGSGSFGYIIGTVGTPVQPNITSISSITSETKINGTISSHITCSSNISATGYMSASGFISAEGNSVLKGLPTTEPSIIGSLWLSGSAGSNSKHLVVFTG